VQPPHTITTMYMALQCIIEKEMYTVGQRSGATVLRLVNYEVLIWWHQMWHKSKSNFIPDLTCNSFKSIGT